MERDKMGGMIGTTLGAAMVGVGLWMLLRDSDIDEMEMTGEESTQRESRLHAVSSEWNGRARSATDGLSSYVGDSPLIAGVAALALGAIAGALIPESQREHELLGDYRDRVAEKAREAAREAMDRGRDMVGNAVQTATETIKEQVMGGGNGRDDRSVGIRPDAEA